MRRLALVLAALRAFLRRPGVEDAVLVQAVTTAVVAHGLRCVWHPDRAAVVRVRLSSGTLVAVCSLCAALLLPAEVAACPVGVSVR